MFCAGFALELELGFALQPWTGLEGRKRRSGHGLLKGRAKMGLGWGGIG